MSYLIFFLSYFFTFGHEINLVFVAQHNFMANKIWKLFLLIFHSLFSILENLIDMKLHHNKAQSSLRIIRSEVKFYVKWKSWEFSLLFNFIKITLTLLQSFILRYIIGKWWSLEIWGRMFVKIMKDRSWKIQKKEKKNI